MILRQKLIMFGTKGTICAELFTPTLFAITFYCVGVGLACPEHGSEVSKQQCAASRSFFMPYVMMFTIPNASAVNARFII